jgi:hypothetical protein
LHIPDGHPRLHRLAEGGALTSCPKTCGQCTAKSVQHAAARGAASALDDKLNKLEQLIHARAAAPAHKQAQ